MAAHRGRQNFEEKMGGGGRFNVNKIHNSFQFMSQNVFFVCNFTAVIS